MSNPISLIRPLVYLGRGELTRHSTRIDNLRHYWKSMHLMARNPVIEIPCAGGCGYVQRVRLSKIKTGQVFVCSAKATRQTCLAALPAVVDGKVKTVHLSQAGHLSGVTWEDRGLLVALAASAREVLERWASAFRR
ncbi:hypothetical protein [Aeromonas aquatica]|uniref:hypothetical protein n=1 Tax=Aeromonas aquatica TaxID=558964 RepID=UPI00051BC20D|nr:hypothetical protein [Aeromonas aquatica]